MDLIPATFACPTHQDNNLTELVREALEEAGPPVAYRRGARPFEVIVTCPGTSPDSAHQLTCTGDYRP